MRNMLINIKPLRGFNQVSGSEPQDQIIYEFCSVQTFINYAT